MTGTTAHPDTAASTGTSAASTSRSTLRPPPVVLTEAPEGVPSIVLARLKTRDLATVVTAPAPGSERKIGPATDILVALGKQLSITGRPRSGAELDELVPLWLTAHRVRRLIVVPNPGVRPANLIALATMTQASPTQVIFACDHGQVDRLATHLAPVAPEPVPWPDHPDLHTTGPLDGHTPTPPPPVWESETPNLPTDEYWTFYATARRVLTPAQFKPVDALYRDTYTRFTDWLSSLGADADLINADLAFDAFKTIIEEQQTADQVSVVIRAAQAAFHRAGWFLKIDERELRNGLIRFPPSKTTPATYALLRGFFEPARAAVVGLYLAGATPAAIRTVTVDDLTHWHRDPTHQIADITPPADLAPYLRAAVLARALEGPTPDAPAFPGDRRRVLRDIRQAATDLGLNIGDANLDSATPIGARRVPARVLKLERIS